MFDFLKRKGEEAPSQKDGFSALSKFGINKSMMIQALRQMSKLSPAQKQQIRTMLKAQMKKEISREELIKGAEDLGNHLKNEMKPEEIEVIKKEFIDLFNN